MKNYSFFLLIYQRDAGIFCDKRLRLIFCQWKKGRDGKEKEKEKRKEKTGKRSSVWSLEGSRDRFRRAFGSAFNALRAESFPKG